MRILLTNTINSMMTHILSILVPLLHNQLPLLLFLVLVHIRTSTHHQNTLVLVQSYSQTQFIRLKQIRLLIGHHRLVIDL